MEQLAENVKLIITFYLIIDTVELVQYSNITHKDLDTSKLTIVQHMLSMHNLSIPKKEYCHKNISLLLRFFQSIKIKK